MTVEEVKLMGFVGLGMGWHFRVLQTPIRKYCRNFTEISFKLMENFRRKKWKNNKKENRKKKKRKPGRSLEKLPLAALLLGWPLPRRLERSEEDREGRKEEIKKEGKKN